VVLYAIEIELNLLIHSIISHNFDEVHSFIFIPAFRLRKVAGQQPKDSKYLVILGNFCVESGRKISRGQQSSCIYS